MDKNGFRSLDTAPRDWKGVVWFCPFEKNLRYSGIPIIQHRAHSQVQVIPMIWSLNESTKGPILLWKQHYLVSCKAFRVN